MLYALLVLICVAATVAGVVAVVRVTRRGTRWVKAMPPVSVLKPLCGVDEGLEANLESFFRQRYPSFELIFGVEGAGDPAIAVVERLRARFPDVACRLVVHDGGRGLNPKVSNLRAMVEVAAHDLAVISDSNVWAPPDYLLRMTAELEGPYVGMVTSLFRGEGEATLGATLENLHLNGPVAASLAASSEVVGKPVVVGKSVLFRRGTFERLGGFESVAAVLAEDYVMGRMFREAGYEVRFAPVVVTNVNVCTSLEAFARRHLRWGVIRWRLNPLRYVVEPVASPLFVGLVAPLFGVAPFWPLVGAVALLLARDALQWSYLRGPAGLLHALPLSPLKELLMLVFWLAAPAIRHVGWRGRRLRLSAGTRLYAQPTVEPTKLQAMARG